MCDILQIALLIIATVITLLSLLINYQLFYHFCCGCITHTEAQTKPQITELPSKSLSITSIATSSNSEIADTSRRSIKTHQKDSTNEIHWFFRYATIATCSLFFGISVCINIANILLVINCDLTGTQKSYVSFIIWPSYFLGRIILCLIFIGTLHFTFVGSAFEYKKSTFYCLGCLWVIMFTCAVISSVFTATSRFRIFGIVLASLFVLIDIVLSCILLYLYLKKLFILIIAANHMLISLMTKYAVLFTICFISSFVIFMFMSMSPAYYHIYIVWMFVSIDSLANTLCLWLRLAIAKPWYHKLCRTCDHGCRLCCANCTKETSKNQNNVISEIKETKSNTPLELTHSRQGSLQVTSAVSNNSAIIL
eukprot:440573_1